MIFAWRRSLSFGFLFEYEQEYDATVISQKHGVYYIPAKRVASFNEAEEV